MKYTSLYIALLAAVVCLYAQDDASGTLNTYEEGSSGFGAPAPEKPEKKNATAPVRSAPAVKSSDESDNTPGPGGEDEHYIQADDYFISDEALTSQAWIWVSLAKMVTAPSSSSKNEAEFMKIRDGNKVWTKYYHRTAIAKNSNLKLGLIVIAFNDNNRDDIYMAPDSKESSRGGGWFMGKVIDLTDLYKGYVTVAGNYKVSPKNLRVIVR